MSVVSILLLSAVVIYTENVSGTAAMVVAGTIGIWAPGEKIGSWDVHKFTTDVLSVNSSEHPMYPNLCGIEKVLNSGVSDWNVIKVLLKELYKKAHESTDKQESD